jgi:hypothetical protein
MVRPPGIGNDFCKLPIEILDQLRYSVTESPEIQLGQDFKIYGCSWLRKEITGSSCKNPNLMNQMFVLAAFAWFEFRDSNIERHQILSPSTSGSLPPRKAGL